MKNNSPLMEISSIQDLCSEFDIGKYVSRTEVEHTFYPTTIIETEKESYILRKLPDNKGPLDRLIWRTQREIGFTNYLHSKGFISNKYTSFQPFLIENKYAVLIPDIKGKETSLDQVDSEFMSAVGTLTGQFHALSHQYAPTGGVIQSRGDYTDPVRDNISEIYKITDIKEDIILPLLDQFQQITKEIDELSMNLPKGLIHTEITYPYLRNTKKGLELTNYEAVTFAPFVFDFTQILLVHCQKDGIFNKELVKAFITAYRKERKLIDDEINAIPQMIIYNALSKIQWILSIVYERPEYVENVKNRIRQFHTIKQKANKLLTLLG